MAENKRKFTQNDMKMWLKNSRYAKVLNSQKATIHLFYESYLRVCPFILNDSTFYVDNSCVNVLCIFGCCLKCKNPASNELTFRQCYSGIAFDHTWESRGLNGILYPHEQSKMALNFEIFFLQISTNFLFLPLKCWWMFIDLMTSVRFKMFSIRLKY